MALNANRSSFGINIDDRYRSLLRIFRSIVVQPPYMYSSPSLVIVIELKNTCSGNLADTYLNHVNVDKFKHQTSLYISLLFVPPTTYRRSSICVTSCPYLGSGYVFSLFSIHGLLVIRSHFFVFISNTGI